ncbi:MAG: fatty acid desaturase [Alphaproteobacteria bacterium]|nr:fatty acid desaturase [Alphaproteobacteria bacterium]
MGQVSNNVSGGKASYSGRLSREQIDAFKARDNHTNLRYIAGIYAVIITAIGAGIWAVEAYLTGGIALPAVVAIVVAAILAVGASQHQLGAVIHEGTHYALFENRKFNELASDYLGGFPIYTSTQAYRLHHFAHHQFVNDPDRDPIATQASESGHWLDFPVTHMQLLKGFVRLINPLNLLRYMVSRAKHSALPQETNPFFDADHKANQWAVHVGVLFAVGVPVVMLPLILMQQQLAALAFLAAAWVAMIAFYVFLPDEQWPRAQIRPTISDRATIIGRMSYLGAVYFTLTAIEYSTGVGAWGYFGLFWILPLFTAFPIFMVLREWIQHGNADRGRLTNSRVFLVDPISRYAVFPLGMDYHLPHHLYASVPHYKLQALHQALLSDPEYALKGQVVNGWFSRGRSAQPCIIDVLGPEYANKGAEIYIDEAATEGAEVRDAAKLSEHSRASQTGKVW